MAGGDRRVVARDMRSISGPLAWSAGQNEDVRAGMLVRAQLSSADLGLSSLGKRDTTDQKFFLGVMWPLETGECIPGEASCAYAVSSGRYCLRSHSDSGLFRRSHSDSDSGVGFLHNTTMKFLLAGISRLQQRGRRPGGRDGLGHRLGQALRRRPPPVRDAGGGPAHHRQRQVRGHVQGRGLRGAHPQHLHLRGLRLRREGLLRGRLWRPDGRAAQGQPLHAVRRHQLGHRVRREEPARRLHQDQLLQGLDQPDPPVLEPDRLPKAELTVRYRPTDPKLDRPPVTERRMT
ncbi:unnamed protein product [Sphagnum tenellum]